MARRILVGTGTAGLYTAIVYDGDTTNPSWSPLNGGLAGADQQIEHLGIDTAHGNRAYVVTQNWGAAGGTVWRNSDISAAANWQHLTLEAPTGYAWTDVNLRCTAVCADPVNTGTVYVLVNDVAAPENAWLYRSLDAGQTWYSFQWGGAQRLGLSITPLQSDPEVGIFAGSEISRVRIRRFNNLRSGTPPAETVLYNGAIAIVWALPSPAPDDGTYWWQYGQGGACRVLVCMLAGDVTDYCNGIGSLTVESAMRARAVTHRTIGAVAGYFQGTNDGATRAFKRTTPDLCSAVYGHDGWYFIGSTSSGIVGTGWHTLWVTADDGVGWSNAAGSDPLTPAADSIPWNCGGVHHIGIFGLGSTGGSTPGHGPSTRRQITMAGWITSGQARTAQGETVWIRKADSFDSAVWGGRAARIEETSESLGGYTVSQRRDPRGGLERDGMMVTPPAEATGALTMKKVQYDRKKSDLKKCFWDFDRRDHCGGVDSDAWNDWVEMTRFRMAKAETRTLSEGLYEGDDVEQTVSFPFMALEGIDLYRVAGSEAVAGEGGGDLCWDVAVFQPEKCATTCDPQEDCIVVAVTEDDAANCYALVNTSGGASGQWTSRTLTGFAANDAISVAGAGHFGAAVSNADASIIRTDDLFVTQVDLTHADFASHAPNAIDMIDQSFQIVVGDDGYIWYSTDALRTLTRAPNGGAGDATASNLTYVMIARDNPLVIYAISNAADVVLRSENGGRTWYAVTATGTGGTGPTALWVETQNRVLIGTDAGEIWETLNGGTTWTEQAELPTFTVKANVTINRIWRERTAWGSSVLYLCYEESAATNYILRNHDGGASGRWYVPANVETLTGGPKAGASCGPNHAIVVGGAAGVSEQFVLLQ